MDELSLSPELRSLLATVRELAPELVRHVEDYAAFLAERHCDTFASEPIEESDVWSDEDLRDWTRGAEHTRQQREFIRAELLREPTASDREIYRRMRAVLGPGRGSRGPVKAVRLEMMDRDEIPGKPWGPYTPYASASGGNRWLPNGHMITQDEFEHRRGNGEFPGCLPRRG